MNKQELLAAFPGLAADGYRETSPPTYDYNCIAWAACRNDQWWEPDPDFLLFWPDGIGRQYTLAAYIAAYQTVGFEVCTSGTFEFSVERIVIFVDATGVPTHAARQLESGKWTSKLGSEVDIEHATPDALTGAFYGQLACFMRRPRPWWRWPFVLLKRALATFR